MEYRQMGKTALRAGAVGLGCEHLDGKPDAVVEETIHAALEGGVNILDIFMPGKVIRGQIGNALAGRRKDVLIQGHIGSTDINQQYDISRDLDICKRYFEELLACLQTDYIDFGMLFYIDNEENYNAIHKNGIVDYARELRRLGVIRHIGASSHNPVMAARLVEEGLVEHLMFSINPAFDMIPAKSDVLDDLMGDFTKANATHLDPTRAKLYTLCAQKGVSITVMKTLAAGKLLKAEHSPFGKALSVGQCIHYALSRPAVVSTLVGAASAAEMRDALRYFELSDEEKDYSSIIGTSEGGMAGSCVYCNHCLPCPSSIDVAAVHRHLDVARLDREHIPAETRAQYEALSAKGGDCVACGSCEKRCPFGVKIIEDMADAKSLFGK